MAKTVASRGIIIYEGNKLKIIFAGTPEFAVPALEALIRAGHEIVMVLTQPDRPAGRGMKMKASPVKMLAEMHHLKVFQPDKLKDFTVKAKISEVMSDVMIVAAYGLIIPTDILNMPRYGCYNIHASLLPRWRGAAPIHRALLAGDLETGVTIMEVVPALDAGAMISRCAIPITEIDTTQTLHDALSHAGAELMVESMKLLEKKGHLVSMPQDDAFVTYAHKLEKAEAKINWELSAIEISRKVRAFNPFPVAQSMLNGEVYRIWQATAKKGKAKAGEIADLADGVLVGCGDGLLQINELQAQGGKRLNANVFLQGRNLKVGDMFV